MKVGFDVNPVENVVDEVPGGEKGYSKAKAKTSSKFCHERDDRINLVNCPLDDLCYSYLYICVAGMAVLTQLFCKMYFLHVSRGRKKKLRVF